MINKIFRGYGSLSETFKAAVWYTFCSFFNKGVSLLATPIFTRILTTEQYGVFTVYRSWFDVVLIFTSLNIFLSGYMRGLLKNKDDQKAFTSTQVSLVLFMTLIFICVFGLFSDSVATIMGLSPVLLIAMSIELLSMPMIEFWMARNRYDNKYKSVVIISIISNLLSIVISIVAVLNFNFKSEAKIFSDVIVKALFAIPIFILLMSQGKKVFSRVYWKYALSFNFPLVPHYLSNYVLGQSDRIMIDKMVGKVQAAFYGVSYTISTLLTLLIMSVNSALTPMVYKLLEVKQYKKISRTIMPVMMLIGVLSVMVMVFAPEIIYLFAGEEYMDAIYIIPPVAASVFFIFVYSMFSNVEYYYQKTIGIAVATTVCALLNIFLNLVFIDMFGYSAAGYTTLASYIALALMHYGFYRRILKREKINKIYNIKYIMICSMTLLVIVVLISLAYDNYIVRYTILAAIMILGILFRKRVVNTIRSLIKEKES